MKLLIMAIALIALNVSCVAFYLKDIPFGLFMIIAGFCFAIMLSVTYEDKIKSLFNR